MHRATLAALVAALLLVGCGSGTDTPAPPAGGYVIMDLRTGDIPYPNDILMDPATGRVDLPTDPNASDYAVKSALNTLDGFSTTAPISLSVTADVEMASLVDHLLFLETSTGRRLTYGLDYTLAEEGGKILILPLRPLAGHSRYIVAITDGVLAQNGGPIRPDYFTSLILQATPLLDAQGRPTVVLDSDPEANLEAVTKLEAIRQHTRQLLTLTALSAEEVVEIWSFTTQTIGAVARAFVDTDNRDATLQLTDTGKTSKEVLQETGYDSSTMSGSAEVYAGVLLHIPYYLGVPDAAHPVAPLTDAFRFEGGSDLPTPTATLSIPVLAVVPSPASGCIRPDAGWPVVIYQHGITRSRTDLLALSEIFTNQDDTGRCFAAVAIDLPLHGVTDPANPFYVETDPALGLSERTFNVDYVTEDAEGNILNARPDGRIDSSGLHYINLRSLLTSRDNIRQSTSDFVALFNALDHAQGVLFDPTDVHFVGHSLGAMAPFGFLADHAPLHSVVLANYGGGIAQLLNHSATFGPIIQQSLEKEGIAPDTAEYDAFMVAAQTILDDADPVNYAEALIANGNRLLSLEVLNDPVIPNAVAAAPLSGTDPMLRLEKAQRVDLSAAPGLLPVGPSTYVLFNAGDHSSFLRPIPSAAVTYEMWGQTRSFLASGGTAVFVQNPSVIAER